MTKPSNVVRPLRLLALPLALLFAGAGCARGPSNLVVKSLKDNYSYRQSFSKAYASRSADGNLDVVLTSDAARSKDASSAVKAAGLRQVMHVRVLWRPMRGTKWDHPSATNATIRWYVFGDPAGQGTEMIEYEGAAFVSVRNVGDNAQLDVQNATLKPTVNASGLIDPIGPAKLNGTIVARISKRQVGEVLARVQTSVAEANSRPAAYKGAAATIEP